MIGICEFCKVETYLTPKNSIKLGDYTSPSVFFCSDKCRKDFCQALPALPVSQAAQVGDIVCKKTGTGDITNVARVCVVTEGFTPWGVPATFVKVDHLWDRNANYMNGGSTFTFKKEI
jgi:hypothetical protein